MDFQDLYGPPSITFCMPSPHVELFPVCLGLLCHYYVMLIILQLSIGLASVKKSRVLLYRKDG